MNLRHFVKEIQRRNVFRVATAYGIAGWLIIQVADTIAPQLGFPAWIPSFVTVLVLTGFPIALILAWAFELTPEGYKKTKTVPRIQDQKARTGRRLNRIIISVLALALLFVLIERIFLAPRSYTAPAAGEASIAVLPFADLSPNGDQEYFSDGLSEELLNTLAGVEALKVAGRTSSFKFKGKGENLTLIGTELNVDHILEGSVRKAGNRIRVTTQLIRVANGYHLWSETYDRELTTTNIFEIQEDISRRVIQELKAKLLPAESERIAKIPTQDLEAYQFYLAGTQLIASRQPEDLLTAIDKFRTATAIDPEFAEAYALLARTYGLLNLYGDLPPTEMKILMRENIDKAFLNDTPSGQAYSALGFLYQRSGDNLNARAAYQKAIELMPNDADAFNGMGITYEFLDRDKLDYYLQRAYEIDPLNAPTAANYAGALLDRNAVAEAIDVVNRLLRYYPDYSGAHLRKAEAFYTPTRGRLDSAFLYLYPLFRAQPDNQQLLLGLYGVARNLHLTPYLDHLDSLLATDFPHTPQTVGNRLHGQLALGRYAQADSLRDFFLNTFGRQLEGFLLNYKWSIAYQQQRFAPTAARFEALYPELVGDSLHIDRNNYEHLFPYLLFQQELGNDERATQYRDRVCQFVARYAASHADRVGAHELLRDQFRCSAVRGDWEQAVRQYERLYFELKDREHLVDDLRKDVVLLALADYPPLQDLRTRMLNDLDQQRQQVITYLRDQGVWQTDWPVEMRW